MKSKILKLLLLFLATGLFVSSEQLADKNKASCKLRCLQQKNYSGSKENKKQHEITDYQSALAPGSYIFYY